MLSYNPGVADRSGEILGEGANNAAMLTMRSMENFGQNIGNALSDIADRYTERKELEAKASSYDDIGRIIGTAMFSENPDAMGALGNLQKEKDPRKKVMGYEQLFSLVGPMSNAMMARGRLGVQQNQPFVNAGLDNAANIAGGNLTVTPGSPMPAGANDPANTVPLPVADTPLPAVKGAPGQTRSVPGGRASWDARNRDRQKQGLQPLPYPPGLE
jgi:hypothetical protein